MRVTTYDVVCLDPVPVTFPIYGNREQIGKAEAVYLPNRIVASHLNKETSEKHAAQNAKRFKHRYAVKESSFEI